MFRSVSARRCASILAGFLLSAGMAVGTSSQSAGATTSQVGTWDVGTTTGCPSNTRVLAPSQPPDAYEANPAGLGVPPGVPNTPLAQQFFERAASAGTQWMTSVTCSPNPVQTEPPPPVSGGSNNPTPNAIGGTQKSDNWAGEVATNPHPPSSGVPFDGAYMNWIIPSVTGADSDADSAIWPGLGSGNNVLDSLAQAGTDEDYSCSNYFACLINDYGESYYFWWEVYPENSSQTVNLAAHPGDQVGVFVGYDTNGGTVSFGYTNYTTNQSLEVQATLGAYESTGNEADWITERPTDAGATARLADFGTISVSTASADILNNGTNSIVFAGGSTIDTSPYHMYDCPNDNPPEASLAYPSSLGNAGKFPFTWQNYGVKGDNCAL